MAWNQPGNNGQDNDPWGNNKNKQTNKTNKSLEQHLKEIFNKRPSGGNNNNGGNSFGGITANLYLIAIAAVAVIALIWGVSGFYTINQSERGVVTRFGQVQPQIIEPGLNWNPPLIDKVYPVDVKGTRNFNVQGFMITAGENLIFVEMNVQYRITNPINYLFNVTNVDESLKQAADSALRTQIGSFEMDYILTDGRSDLESKTKDELMNIIANYNMGITIVDLNFQSVRPPEEVQEAFNDAIKAREDKEREINKAKADAVQVEQQAAGRSARILAEANAYKVKTVLEAEGDVARIEKLIPEFKAAPEITRERLYIQTMEKILSDTSKVLVSDKSGNLLVLPLEQLLNKNVVTDKSNLTGDSQINSSKPAVVTPESSQGSTSNSTRVISNTTRTLGR